MWMHKLFCATVLSALVAVASSSTAFAAPAPVTYLNANFGPPNASGIAFYRSPGSIKLQSPTASVSAKASGFEVDFSADASMDPDETSSGFSSYDIGTVNIPGSPLGGLNG